ncbi:MAG: type II toxin-antitoxin system HicA family toxin [Candidatus Moranbacteria bacterium]|nr:type II toxin-antitoxin system HicA family toxin [Candidatus Moranbacteria bacterium]
MGRLSGFKYKEITKKLKQFGFVFLRGAKGSHEIWYNQNNNLFTTVPRHRGDMPEGTLKAILKQAKIEVDKFLEK